MDNKRNIILFVVLSALMLLGWEAFSRWYFPQPQRPAVEQSTQASSSAAEDEKLRHSRTNREGGLHNAADIAAERKDLATDLAAPVRVKIDAPKIAGSINPVGARIDDLTLNRYRVDLDKSSDPVRLFSPAGTPAEYFSQFGFVLDGELATSGDTPWQTSGGPLAPGKPVTLSWNNGKGQQLSIKFSVDDHYMITAEQTVSNTGAAPVVVQPYALIKRTSKTASGDSWNVHSGPIGAFDEAVTYGPDYDDLAESGSDRPTGRPDWMGFTDIYWLSALVAQNGQKADAQFRSLGGELFQADLNYQPVTVPAGKAFTRTTRLFAGAKESDVLGAYQDAGIPNFSRAIDWGWFEILEKPILWLLKHLFALVGNFGVAIMLLTVVIRGLMFPIAQKQFASMAAMRAIQPKMKALQERYKDDKQKQQQEVMALYKAEGVNPLAGCLPLLLQIPIFFALYKVLILSLDMRHQPFALWIKDLSAPDPVHFLNLFGLLDFTPEGFLAIGPLALLLGFTMYLQFKLNPAQMDPVQQQMFMFMPWIMMFVMAPFATGLLLYWCTSNLLTIAQQAYLYSRHPQLKAQAEKDKSDQERAKARDKKG
ncbi:membrane protein insertase YidC [Altererythrobacter sp. CC-YST694]|uniref:membrane protein insertase YidC n=1 Tax=Altererythrobacter sp. CC-YST694 TaxID=2755038 RepID=UPI001D0287B8|nr:membrane protein insertase YidC [Altererythrobacter sp. CC-YST694]MCB5425745.1 membrane protein insertase YidC [Altererythrobacter sp. CC-YST694]